MEINNLNIIILTHNNLPSTEKCLYHLYKHTKNFNLIIIENNSTDETSTFLNNLNKNFTLIHLKENKGVITGRNIGYKISEKIYPDTEYTCFLDNDQFVLSGWKESYIKLFEQGYDIIGCEAWKIRKKDFYPEKKIINKNEEFNYVGAGGMMLKNNIMKDIGGFEEIYSPMYFEDPNLCWTAYKKGYKIGCNFSNLIIHQPHKLLTPKRKIYFNKSWKNFQNKWKNYKMPILKML